MINGRLIRELGSAKKYVFLNVFFQWLSLVSNIAMIYYISIFISDLYYDNKLNMPSLLIAIIVNLIIRSLATKIGTEMTHKISVDIKSKLRNKLYNKIYQIGSSYENEVGTTEVIQLGTEGIEQLDMYYCRYIPQLIYSVVAPITLFVFISRINIKIALVLLICVPLIPFIIGVIQGVARKLFGTYWGDYTDLSKIFLENIQGLTILKSYKADEMKNEQMNEKAEQFRKSTMKVLYMQLNSIIAMDIVAFGGAALGIGFALYSFKSGEIGLAATIMIILLSSEFFIPMRLLGSFFHVAMNGMAASKRIFSLIDYENRENRNESIEDFDGIKISNLEFGYSKDKKILKGIDMDIPSSGLISIVGESGSGKSTIASIIMGISKNYLGNIKISDKELKNITEESIMKNITLVRHDSYIYKGTVRENLLVAKPDATEKEMQNSLKKVNLYEFFANNNGLDTKLDSEGSNLSGGQKQRLALARALLHDTPAYIFDEVSSNIDAESEEDIMNIIQKISLEKTVILISHRLANVVNSDTIYMLKDGLIESKGTHLELMNEKGSYEKIYSAQKELEEYSSLKREVRAYA
ncbi:MAG: ABC transporter ATP-binding protein/permease [Andreesenia angusta]|nr:ABC transporter ATP-binding protein/permease [Andreesenia angusta]